MKADMQASKCQLYAPGGPDASSGAGKGGKITTIKRLCIAMCSSSPTWPAMLAKRPRAHHVEVAASRAPPSALPNQPTICRTGLTNLIRHCRENYLVTNRDFDSNLGRACLESKVDLMMPSLASLPHTREAASVTNFTVRSTATVWHGYTVKDHSGSVLSGSESLSTSSLFDTVLRTGGTVIETSVLS